MIKEVVADVDVEAGEIILILHWMGGVHTELRLPRRRRGQRNSTSQDIIAAVRQLVLIANDELIAGILNRNKLTTGHGNRWTRERVTALRSHHKIPVYCPAGEGHEPWLNLSKAAAHLQISPKTLRLAAECREIDALHPCRTDLGSSAALSSTAQPQKRLSFAPGTAQTIPRDRIPINKTSSFQQHREMGVMKRGCSFISDLTPLAQRSAPSAGGPRRPSTRSNSAENPR